MISGCASTCFFYIISKNVYYIINFTLVYLQFKLSISINCIFSITGHPVRYAAEHTLHRGLQRVWGGLPRARGRGGGQRGGRARRHAPRAAVEPPLGSLGPPPAGSGLTLPPHALPMCVPRWDGAGPPVPPWVPPLTEVGLGFLIWRRLHRVACRGKSPLQEKVWFSRNQTH